MSTEITKKNVILDVAFILIAIVVFVLGLCNSNKNLSSIGLTFDVTGFILLFGFVVPSRVGTYFDFHGPRSIVAKITSWIGAILIVTGSVFQYVSSISL